MDTEADPFETVVIAYSQPQATVLMSLFAWHGIPAYALGIGMVQTNATLALALGGVPIRVRRDVADEARALLAAAAINPEPPAARSPRRRAASGFWAVAGFLLAGVAPPPRVSAVVLDAAE